MPPPGLVRAAALLGIDDDATGDAGGLREAAELLLLLLLLAAALSACFAFDAPPPAGSFLASLAEVAAFGAALPLAALLPLI